MEIIREKEIEFFGKKEKVKVSLTIPVPPNKTKAELIEEYGDIGFVDESAEILTEKIFGSIANQLVCYICATLNSGSESGTAIALLSKNISNAGIELVNILKARKDVEKMS